MSLQDVDDLPAAVSEIARILVDDGVSCIAIVHPLNSAGRFENASATSPFVITFFSRHRTIEAYSRALESAGLVIDALREPSAPDAAVTVERSVRKFRQG